MRFLFFILYMICAVVVHSQSRISVGLAIKQEILSYPYDYSSSGEEIDPQHTWSIGLRGGIQYRLQEHIFIETGIGFIRRQFHVRAFFEQSAIPPPRQSWSNELVHADKVQYHILEFPVNIGYAWKIDALSSLQIKAGYVFDYLVSTRYVNNINRYDGTYEKKTWLGSSPTAGIRYQYNLQQQLMIFADFIYNFQKTGKPDPYLIRWSKPVEINYRSTALIIGISRTIN